MTADTPDLPPERRLVELEQRSRAMMDSTRITPSFDVTASEVCTIVAAVRDRDRLAAELTGIQKAHDLLLKGMESIEELRAEEKQKLRTAEAELAEAKRANADLLVVLEHAERKTLNWAASVVSNKACAVREPRLTPQAEWILKCLYDEIKTGPYAASRTSDGH